MKLVFLPATDPTRLELRSPAAGVSAVCRSYQAECVSLPFDTLVWYTQPIRADALERIRAICAGEFAQIVLVGFSKS